MSVVGRRRPTAETRAVFEDVEFMLACGEWPERAAARVGKSRDALWNLCYRHGRDDLAQWFRASTPDPEGRS